MANFSRRPSRRAALPADTVALVEHTGYRSVNDKTRLCPAVTTRVFRAGLHFRTSRVSVWIYRIFPFLYSRVSAFNRQTVKSRRSDGERKSGANDLYRWGGPARNSLDVCRVFPGFLRLPE